MIIMEIILILIVRDGNVAVQRVDEIGRRVTIFLWTDECYWGVECVLLIANGGARADMSPSSEIGFKFARICKALLVRAN